jgi:hypothetical protein
MRAVGLLLACGVFVGACGCIHPRFSITAVALSPQNQGEPHGIPYYLPKPLLIISKNFRNIEEAHVGLTDTAPIPTSFDDQAKYADVNARLSDTTTGAPATTSPQNPTGTGSAYASGPRLHSDNPIPLAPDTAPSDGLTPETFFTYQIVFVPDLTQKYGLRLKGGPGEVRAALQMVNGWQFTGLGPFYLKDSSSAQNCIACGIATELGGRGVADVISSLADLAQAAESAGGTMEGSRVAELMDRIDQLQTSADTSIGPGVLSNFAEIHVFEPILTPELTMEWREIACFDFSREYLAGKRAVATMERGESVPEVLPPPQPESETDRETLRMMLGALGYPVQQTAVGEAALEADGGTDGPTTNVTVNCGSPRRCRQPAQRQGLLSCCHEQEPHVIQNRTIVGLPTVPGTPADHIPSEGRERGQTSVPSTGGSTPSTDAFPNAAEDGDEDCRPPFGVFQQFLVPQSPTNSAEAAADAPQLGPPQEAP